MTLQQLRYFVEMADTLHYTRAAENLNISQPSLSYALQELSKELSVPLFETTGKKNILTNYGEAFLPYVESALNILDQGRSHLENMINPSADIISLGYIYSVSFDVVPGIIDAFYSHQGNKNIKFNFLVDKANYLIDKLLDGSLDLVISSHSELKSEDIEVLPITRQMLYLMVNNSHPLSSKEEVSFEDFADSPLVMIQKNTDLYATTEQLFKSHRAVANTSFIVDECNSMAAFVGSDLGIAIMPKIPALDSYNIKALPFEDKTIYRDISLLRNKNTPITPALRIFLDFCYQELEHPIY